MIYETPKTHTHNNIIMNITDVLYNTKINFIITTKLPAIIEISYRSWITNSINYFLYPILYIWTFLTYSDLNHNDTILPYIFATIIHTAFSIYIVYILTVYFKYYKLIKYLINEDIITLTSIKDKKEFKWVFEMTKNPEFLLSRINHTFIETPDLKKYRDVVTNI